jgi:dephospho-CoA kinase
MPAYFQGQPHKRLVLGITGRIGAGKTSAAKYLSSKYKFQYLRYSQVLSDWLANDSESKLHLQEVGWKVMAEGMQAELNRRLIEQIQPPPANVAADGLRHPIDYGSLKKSFGSSFQLLYIESSPERRWNRLKAVGRYPTFDSFNVVDSHPVEQQIERLRECAVLELHNEGLLQDLYMALDKLIQNFRGDT